MNNNMITENYNDDEDDGCPNDPDLEEVIAKTIASYLSDEGLVTGLGWDGWKRFRNLANYIIIDARKYF